MVIDYLNSLTSRLDDINTSMSEHLGYLEREIIQSNYSLSSGERHDLANAILKLEMAFSSLQDVRELFLQVKDKTRNMS